MDKYVIRNPQTSSESTVSTSATSSYTCAPCCAQSSCKTIEDKDNPSSEDGQKKERTYQARWKNKFPWLVCETTTNKIFCEFCTTAKNMTARFLQQHMIKNL